MYVFPSLLPTPTDRRTRGRYTISALEDAVKAVLKHGMTPYAASSYFKIPRSTIQRRVTIARREMQRKKTFVVKHNKPGSGRGRQNSVDARYPHYRGVGRRSEPGSAPAVVYSELRRTSLLDPLPTHKELTSGEHAYHVGINNVCLDDAEEFEEELLVEGGSIYQEEGMGEGDEQMYYYESSRPASTSSAVLVGAKDEIIENSYHEAESEEINVVNECEITTAGCSSEYLNEHLDYIEVGEDEYYAEEHTSRNMEYSSKECSSLNNVHSTASEPHANMSPKLIPTPSKGKVYRILRVIGPPPAQDPHSRYLITHPEELQIHSANVEDETSHWDVVHDNDLQIDDEVIVEQDETELDHLETYHESMGSIDVE